MRLNNRTLYNISLEYALCSKCGYKLDGDYHNGVVKIIPFSCHCAEETA